MSNIIPTKQRKRRVAMPKVDASSLKDAYRLLAKVSHTDVNGDSSHETMVEINTRMDNIKVMQAKQWHIGIVLDDSGSMKKRKGQAIKAYNSFISNQRYSENVTCNLNTFHENIPINKLEHMGKLTRDNYNPSGNTPLYDTIALTIQQIVTQLPGNNDVIVFIVTDGCECASREWCDPNQLRQLIEAKIDLGWQFVYASCTWNALTHAAKIGIPHGSVTSFTDLNVLMDKVSHKILSYRMGEIKQITFSGE